MTNGNPTDTNQAISNIDPIHPIHVWQHTESYDENKEIVPAGVSSFLFFVCECGSNKLVTTVNHQNHNNTRGKLI